jgi:hypothetical protein
MQLSETCESMFRKVHVQNMLFLGPILRLCFKIPLDYYQQKISVLNCCCRYISVICCVPSELVVIQEIRTDAVR